MKVTLGELRRIIAEAYDPESLQPGGWYLKDYQKRWLASGEASLLTVAIDDLIPRQGEDFRLVPKTSNKVLGILKDWDDGYRHPVPDGVRLDDGRIQVTDGRHRIAAASFQNRVEVPIIVGN